MGTNFFTNEDQNTLLNKIEGVFKYKKVHFFDALVGYFRASGYFRIRKFIQQTPKIRFLVGINVDKLTYQANQQGKSGSRSKREKSDCLHGWFLVAP